MHKHLSHQTSSGCTKKSRESKLKHFSINSKVKFLAAFARVVMQMLLKGGHLESVYLISGRLLLTFQRIFSMRNIVQPSSAISVSRGRDLSECLNVLINWFQK